MAYTRRKHKQDLRGGRNSKYMNHVPRQWLRQFQAVLVGLDLIVIGLYIYGRFFTAAPPVAEHATAAVHSHNASGGFSVGLTTPIVAVLALIHLVSVAGIVWWIDKKYTWFAHAPALLLFGVMLVLLTNSDSPAHMVYHVFLMVFMFLATMVGTIVAGVTFALAFILLIINSLGSGHLTMDPAGHVIEMVLVSMSAATASAGWFIFHKKYIQNIDTKILTNLTNMVKQERTTVGLILESITDGVMLINTDGVVQIINGSCARILGWSKEDARNLHYEALLQPVQAADSKTVAAAPSQKGSLSIPLAASSGQAQHQVMLAKTRDNRQIYLDITASPIFQEEKETEGTLRKVVGVIVVVRDVDKQKREEQQRSEFISTASHEMRTPVAAIEGYLALALNSKVSSIDVKARSYLEKAHASTQHLGKLFQDLLTSAKAEDGRLVSHPVVIEMGAYLEQLSDSLRFAAEKKGLLVDFTIGSSSGTDPNGGGKVIKPLYYVLADPDRIREVITNIFDNAVKYTETGKISIGLTGNNELVQFFVRDTGPGIPAADLPHLFQKFYRVDSSATRTIGGTGLGLFISRKIIELYKGRVWVESEIGKGSTFYINLPRMSTQKAEEQLRVEAAQQANTSPLDNAPQAQS